MRNKMDPHAPGGKLTQAVKENRTIYWYVALVFLVSALVMVLEVAAGRLVAPYLGLSMYSWSLVVSIILCGLAIGHWLGGIWADDSKRVLVPAWALLCCGFASLAIVVVVIPIGAFLDSTELNLLTASVLFVLPLFFIPAICLGLVPPFIIARALRLDARTGHIVGLMQASAVLGSVFALYLSAFFLIPYLGTRNTIILVGVICLLLAASLLWFRKKTLYISGFMAVSLFIAIVIARPHSLLCVAESISVCLRVDDVSELVPYGNAKALMRDHMGDNISYEQNGRLLVAPDAHLIYELLLQHLKRKSFNDTKVFFAGSGGFALPRALRLENPKVQIVIAESESQIENLASRMFWHEADPARVATHYRDPRQVLLTNPAASLDLVIGDVFNDIVVPYHLLSLEYLRLVKLKLKADGLLIINLNDIYPDPQLLKAVVKTMRLVFRHVDVWIDAIPEQASRASYVVSASNQEMKITELTSQAGWFPRQWTRDTAFILAQGKPLESMPVLTDDYAPVELLLSSLLFSKLGRSH